MSQINTATKYSTSQNSETKYYNSTYGSHSWKISRNIL